MGSGVVEENVPGTGAARWINPASLPGIPLKWDHTPSSPSDAMSRFLRRVSCGEAGKGARFEITVPKGMWRMKEVNQ
ncbi:MAG: hypothetical protein NTV84_09660 [Methanoregula sp.]|nr:hypothetical protein [Methanoregula sp.]